MIPFKATELPKSVDAHTMQSVYEKLKTPYKHGAVCIRDDALTDSPSVFRFRDKWYMMYLTISKECATSGYNTWLGESDDLINWKPVKAVMDRNGTENWDSKQIAGYLGLPDVRWQGDNIPQTVGGKYIVTYLGGNCNGYEPNPLYMGLAEVGDFTDPDSYIRSKSPILSPDDNDARKEETQTLFRSFIFADEKAVTGYPYVMVYNAKDPEMRERILLAVSSDAIHWERYGDAPVLDGTIDNPNNKIVGDAQIITMDDLYVMIYFSYDYGKAAYSTFACSYDLVHWTCWSGKPLIYGEYDWEDGHAHKSWVLHHEGVTYNYYCAVNKRDERFIALATSVPKKE